ncbi:MAG: hypothetical protein RLZ47_1194 [Bacteroidota bacterium]|jgi:hypothetical protein
MDKNDQLFASLLYLFHTSGMQGLGKLMNPVTQKTEKNLEHAKESIEMLEMLKQKTQGNLSADLSRLLDQFLSDLRLNYVDEAKNQ